MINSNKILNSNFRVILTICFINSIYLFFSLDNPWIIDDFGLIFPIKLFNLINDNTITFQSFVFSEYASSYVSKSRYVPLYDFFNQFLPSSSLFFQIFVVSIYTICAVSIYFISFKIFENKNIALFSSILFSINYSISIKMLTWNLFYNHILACVFGFLAIVFFLNINETKRFQKAYTFLYILFSCFAFLTSEIGLVFPILNITIYYFFINKKFIIKNIFISFFPIIIFIFLIFLNTGRLLPLFLERVDERSGGMEEVFNNNDQNTLYFNRSTYAPRNKETYFIRSVDNLMSSINILSIEKVLKFYDSDSRIKDFLKKNYQYFYLALFILLLVFLIILLRQKYTPDEKSKIVKLFAVYLLMMFTFTIVFFRRDLNIALSFSSALLISYLVNIFLNKNLRYIVVIILFFFLSPTILYYLTKFEYTMTDLGPKTDTIVEEEKLFKEALSGKINDNYKNLRDYKYFYYYINFENNKQYLISEYKGLSYTEFNLKFSKKDMNF